MVDNPPVNRCLQERHFDHIDHALGRPTWPLQQSYRNYFSTPADSDDGRAFEASPHWQRGGTSPGGLTTYRVTDAGRAALDEHLRALGVHNRFTVTFAGRSQVVCAATAAKARYIRWCNLVDVLPDLTFSSFLRLSTVAAVVTVDQANRAAVR